MSSELQQLRAILNTTIDRILSVCSQQEQSFPSLNEPADLSELSQTGIRNHPEISDAIPLAVAAASQLIATLQPPTTTLCVAAARYTLSACIGAAERTHVAEILREAGPDGLHVVGIANQAGTDPGKLGRVLRYLSTNHIFREIAPDVFAHNLVSSFLDTGKRAEGVIKTPIAKFDNTDGLAAIISMFALDCMKSCAYLPETLTDPKTALSQEPTDTSFQKAHRITTSRWAYLDRPENAVVARRYAAAMSGTARLQPPEAIVASYDWTSVPHGGLFVDVGGNIGSIVREVVKIRPDLHFVIEDRPLVVEKAKAYWANVAPEVLATGHINMIATDFFEPQPALSAPPDIFFLRNILHDWSDKYATKLLRRLRDAAKATTRLLVNDCLIQYACPIDEASVLKIPGYTPRQAPSPLLPNFGLAAMMLYDLDITMLNNLNARERTLGAFQELFSQAGWQLVEVRANAGGNSWYPTLVAEPMFESQPE